MHEREMGRSSGWMFLDAANDLFANARLRVCGDPKKGINKGDLNKKYFYTKDNKGTSSRVQTFSEGEIQHIFGCHRDDCPCHQGESEAGNAQ